MTAQMKLIGKHCRISLQSNAPMAQATISWWQTKRIFNKDEVFAKLNYWLEEDYGIISAQHQYRAIPHRIIIEKNI
ncbi:MAG: hypothetical protein L6V88_07975 [Anaerotruncus sp.]|nr:MAG: hypothetical protein L6V88_07975 [Anaerotruncus sp.]